MTTRKIIPSFDFYKKLDNHKNFEFTLLEESYNPYDASHPHRHNYYEVLYFNKAGGTHEIDFRSFPILKNSFHFISPEQVHLLKRNKSVTGYVISFTDEFFLTSPGSNSFIDTLPFFNNAYTYPVISISKAEMVRVVNDLINSIRQEWESGNEDKNTALVAWMTLLLTHASRLFAISPNVTKAISSRSALLLNFKKLIEKNFRHMKTVREYAGMLNLSSGHLSDSIHKETGKTAGEIIHDRIILEAKRLLYHSEKSVKEIAADLNYEDPSYFSKFFKSRTRTTPDQFRKSVRDNYH